MFYLLGITISQYFINSKAMRKIFFSSSKFSLGLFGTLATISQKNSYNSIFIPSGFNVKVGFNVKTKNKISHTKLLC